MKRRTTLFLTSVMLLIASGLRAVPSAPQGPFPYQLHILAEVPDHSRQMKQFVESETIQGILEADLAPWASLEPFGSTALDACTLSITVTVRVGFDSNFVEASGTVDGIACDDVVNAIRRLRDQLLAGIQ